MKFVVLSFVFIGLSHVNAQTKTRVTGAANWSTASTWIQIRTGTIAFTIASKTVTGTGTAFLTELQVGDILVLDASPGTIRGTVASIASNTSLQLVANATATVATSAYGRQRVPGSSDNVQIGNINLSTAATVTLDASAAISSLTFVSDNVAHSLTHSGTNSLTISGTVTVNQPTGALTNAWNINSGTASISGLLSMAGTTSSARISKIILTSGTLNAYGGISIAGTSVTNKVIDMSAGAATLNLKGDLVGSSNATLTAGVLGSTFNYADDAAAQTVTMFGSGAYYNLSLNNTSPGGATLGAAITTANLKENLRVLSGTFDNGGFAIALNTSKVFEVANNATFKLTGTSAMVTGTTITKTFSASSTVEYGGGAQIISAEVYGNLTSSGTGPRTLSTLGTISIAGAFIPGTNTYTITNSSVSFNGTARQYIPAFSFHKLLIENASGVTLSGDVSVTAPANALIFTSGKVITGSNTLSLGSASAISGAGTGKYIAGRLKWTIATGAITKIFPVGDENNYTPLTVAFAAVTVLGALTVDVAATDHPNLGTSGIRGDKSVNRYWSLTNSGIMFTTATLTLNWVSGDVDAAATTSGFKLGNYVNPNWTIATVSSAAATSIQATPITSFGDFAVGELCAVPGTFSYAATSYCTGEGSAVPTITGTAGVFTSASGLTINASTGAIDLALSTAGAYIVTNTSIGGCTSSASTAAVVILAPGTWTGAVSNNWSIPGNWACGTVPAPGSDVAIPSGLSTFPLIASGETRAVKNITLYANATVTVNGVLQVKGTVTNSGSIDALNGAITMSGTSTQAIPAGLFSNNTVNDLTVNNAAGVTLGGVLNISNVLSISNGSLTTGGYLTLKSSASNTARVAQITSAAATPIIGYVTVERYIQGRRKYRLITSSVTTSPNAPLSAGQENLSIWGNWQNQGNNTTGNAGTFITGGSSADGFDQQTSGTSLYTYNPTTKKYVAFSSANGLNTKYTRLTAGVPYYMFVYGDRVNSASSATPNHTVLKATGTLLTGNQVYNTNSSIPLNNIIGGFTLLGNPYAAVIDWASIQATNLSGTMWGWDANLSSTGGYVTVTNSVLGPIVSPMSPLVKVNQYIQPGQAFFVQTTAADPQLIFKESDKVDAVNNVNNTIFRRGRTGAKPLIALNLLYNNAGTAMLTDGAVAVFDASFSNSPGIEDATKMVNSTEGIAFQEKEALLGINCRQLPVDKDTIFLNVARLTRSQYTLQLFTQDVGSITAQPYLEDTYLNTSVALSITDTNNIVFNVSPALPASSAANRFRIVFKAASVLPLTYTSVQATAKEKYILVEWRVASQIGIQKYEVERSADGVKYTRVGEVSANTVSATEGYTWKDATPSNGNNYYRIRAVQVDGKVYLTKVVWVKPNVINNEKFVVFSNPVKNQQITFQLNGIQKGQYTLQLYNSAGKKMLTRSLSYFGSVINQCIQVDRKLSAGIYYMEVASSNEKYYCTLLVE